jgi:hypothetical protein
MLDQGIDGYFVAAYADNAPTEVCAAREESSTMLLPLPIIGNFCRAWTSALSTSRHLLSSSFPPSLIRRLLPKIERRNAIYHHD